MAYTVPNFNLFATLYSSATGGPIGPPLHVNVPCQMYFNARSTFGGPTVYYMARFPVGSVPGIGGFSSGAQYQINVPAGSAKWYQIDYVGKEHVGFTNEYWFAYAYEFDVATWPLVASVNRLP